MEPGMVILSECDPREIKIVTLKNKMKLVLISDPIAKKSAASLDIGIGCLHAPMDLHGLAVVLQHLILNGSKKYPDLRKNGDFFAKHRGSVKATTLLDNTNYKMEIDNNGFEEAIDRFANYFISPIFNL